MQLQNAKTLKEFLRASGFTFSEGSYLDVEKRIVPVVEINPESHRKINVVKTYSDTATGTGNIYLTPSDRDFFLCQTILSSAQDASSDNLEVAILAQINGTAGVIVASLRKITLTAFTGNQTISYVRPIKIDRNTFIQISGAWTVGSGSKRAIIFGYETDAFENA